MLAGPVKLVIWDLDDTFWSGTLSEGGVVIDPTRVEMVRELNRRGIVNSICSKNDYEQTRARLIDAEAWGEFVFVSITWAPKGAQIKAIIEDMGLRGPNVLFIDDNISNIQEARHYVPGLQTADPSILGGLLEQPQLGGKNDLNLSRLNQYRVLEEKRSDRAQAIGTNEDFLRSCDIRVELVPDCEPELQRLMELMNRTNQLNYTKRRVTEDGLEAMLQEKDRDTRYVRVRDRYGDYGICGFYSVQPGSLTHFVFSCRILHMGVERWLYNYLGHPPIEVSGEVATPLENCEAVNWITLGAAAPMSQPPSRPIKRAAPVLLKGGCDLWVLNGFLDGSLTTELTTVSGAGHDVVGHHTILLRQSVTTLPSEHREIVERLPFLDHTVFESRLTKRANGLSGMVYSVLQDYSQGLYRLKGSDLLVPYGQYDEPATDSSQWPYYLSRWRSVGINEDFLAWFADRFDYEGALTPEAFRDNVKWMYEQLPPGALLVLINGAEVELDTTRERDRHLRHRMMNRVLDEVVAELPNAHILDVRQFVRTPTDVTDNIRHYTRPAYLHMATALHDLVPESVDVEVRPLFVKALEARRKLQRARARLAAGG